MEIMLKIGNVPAGTAVKVSDVKIEKTEGSYSQITLTGFSYPTVTGGSTEPNSFALEANSGAAAEMTGNGSSATATVTTPVADWNVKFYAKPGLELKAGTQYQVSFNVTNASGCKACFKDLSVSGDNAETAYGEETQRSRRHSGHDQQCQYQGTADHSQGQDAGHDQLLPRATGLGRFRNTERQQRYR